MIEGLFKAKTYERIGQRRFSVVHVSDDGHISDVGLLLHHLTDLADREVHLKE